MSTHKFNVRYVIARNKVRADGRAPMFCRLTYRERRKQFSTGLFIDPVYWNSKRQALTPENDENSYINSQIHLIRSDLNKSFLMLQVNKSNFDVEDIYTHYKGDNIKDDKTIMDVFSEHNARMHSLIGKEYSVSTYRKFIEASNHVRSFIRYHYKKQDYLLSELTLKFIQDFDYYLKSVMNHKQITINKSIQRVRKIVKLALASGYLSSDPFLLYKPKKVISKVIFLTDDELKYLEECQLEPTRLRIVRDMFILCCYTGLAYAEMKALKSSHIKEGFDGQKWIVMNRQKTGRTLRVPLLPRAIEILIKYDIYNSRLPVITNQKFNLYLKEIALIVGVKKRLTHHVARKTFASTVLLYNGVPIEIVSELLGHSSIKITQDHYGKIVQKKMSEQMIRLSKKLTS